MSRIRLHVVDDDRDAVDLLRGYLLHADCDLTASYSGQEALAKLRETPPDLVLLDVQMPGLDGFETLTALRVDARLRHLPVIFLSSFDRPNLKVRALEMGADDYVVKPCHPAELVARVRAVLRRRQAEPPAEGKFAGDLSHFPLATLLQSLAIAGRDATVCFPARHRDVPAVDPRDASLDRHGLWAWIALTQGKFADACCGNARGPEALLRLLLCPNGRFETRFDESLEPVEASRAIAVDGLLLGLMVTLDETRDLLAAIGELDTALVCTDRAGAEVCSWFAAAETGWTDHRGPGVTVRQLLLHTNHPLSDTATLLVAAHRRGEIAAVEVPPR